MNLKYTFDRNFLIIGPSNENIKIYNTINYELMYTIS
jgi:hypothetical protein